VNWCRVRRVETDEEILDLPCARPGYHPSYGRDLPGMGHDPMAVVDDRLRVHGLQGLRIADASIMPTIRRATPISPA